MSLFDRVAELRLKKGLSQNALEKEVGLPRNTICKWDKSIPSSDKLKLVADYFGVTMEYLLTGENREEEMFFANLTKSQRILIDHVCSMTEEQAENFIKALSAFLGERR